MNIIFGTDNAEKLQDKYTLLELDTFRFKDQDEDTVAYCVLENIPLDELSLLTEKTQKHAQLIEAYKNKNWSACLENIDELLGSWNGEVDSYYENIKERTLILNEDIPNDWNYVIVK